MASHEAMAGAGFSDWQRAVERVGNHKVARIINQMDPGNSPSGRNAHAVIAERLGTIELPVQEHVALPVREFLAQPQDVMDRIPHGDYYFASIVPGIHLAHGETSVDVIEFVNSYATDADEKALATELYLSHNGEAVMSGHIIVRDDGEPNTILAEFTTGNFNAFHRGSHTPEISAQRHDYRFHWQFRESLAAGDWRGSTETYPCQAGIKLTRIEMAQRAFEAISCIPHDGALYLPGYYEVLLERVNADQTKPVFIEANFSGMA